jgi:hypothetical protein
MGQQHLQALTGGFHLAWALGAGAVAAGALVALVWLRRPPVKTEAVPIREEQQPVALELEAA